jgi:hypothetical protein
MLNACVAEARVFHPAAAVCSGVVEPAIGFDEHVQAHHQAKDVLRSVVVNQLCDQLAAESSNNWRRSFHLSVVGDIIIAIQCEAIGGKGKGL